MKKFLLIILATLLICGCGSNEFKHINHEEAQKIIASNSEAIIVDVRAPEEYSKKHIQNALLVPLDDLKAGDFSRLPDKNATILIYCWTGRRAEDAAQILIDNGYKKVYEMGGLIDWTGAVEGADVE